MIGDRDTDVICGRSVGTRTILIQEPKSAKYRQTVSPDYYAGNLKEAVNIIISEDNKNVKGD